MSVDETVEHILRSFDTITVVGASNDPRKPANTVPRHMQTFGWRIVPINPRGGVVVGEAAVTSLAELTEPPAFVDVFRPSEQAADVARQAVAAGARALWLQLGIVSDDARAIAENAGLLFVQDRCLIVEQRRTGLRAPRN